MLRALAEKLPTVKSLTVHPVAYDASHLGDELATRTDWGPAKGGGASFCTHRLVDAGPRRVEFRATKGALAFFAAFALMGLMALVIFPVAAFNSMGLQWLTLAFLILPLVVGTVFVAVGSALWYYVGAPIVFDKQRGEYWKSRVPPEAAANRHAMKDRVALDRIHALQLISELCEGDDSTYTSYELNLVLDDATRLNVVDHGNREELRRDAEALAKFLGRPLWDATA
ncbi:MAG: hypothetical protein ABL963_11480 [Longimicrobiales bacterium]